MRNKLSFIALFLMLLWLPESHALELYSVVRSQCNRATGLIIHVDANVIYLLNTEGRLTRLQKEGIEQILVYNTLDNPISHFYLDSELADFLRNVDIQGDSKNNFTGWPIRFLEDLIVFYDLKGKIHLVDADMIQGFKMPDSSELSTVKIEKYETYLFGFGNNLSECETQTGDSGKVVQPTRMISDPIAISKFLKVYQAGFNKLNRFQKRTSFYARPYLYEKKTKVGIVVDRKDFQEELPGNIPINFKWPTGSNYGPQGLLKIGTVFNQNLPNVEPVFAFDFSGKYHFLSVSFLGNIWAFSYGQSYIIENRSMFSEFFSKRDSEDLLVFPQYNQLAMTGLEWGPYSFSAGYYYPIIGMQARGVFREILSEQSMPIINLKYTTPVSKLQLLFSDINVKSDSPSENSIKLIYAEEMAAATTLTQSSKDLIEQLDHFNLHSQFMRFNFDMDLNQDVSVGISEVFFQGEYEEKLAASDYKLSFKQFITSVGIQQEFGDYVSLKGNLNYFIRQYHPQSSDHDKDFEENKFSFTVVVEFIL